MINIFNFIAPLQKKTTVGAIININIIMIFMQLFNFCNRKCHRHNSQ